MSKSEESEKDNQSSLDNVPNLHMLKDDGKIDILTSIYALESDVLASIVSLRTITALTTAGRRSEVTPEAIRLRVNIAYDMLTADQTLLEDIRSLLDSADSDFSESDFSESEMDADTAVDPRQEGELEHTDSK